MSEMLEFSPMDYFKQENLDKLKQIDITGFPDLKHGVKSLIKNNNLINTILGANQNVVRVLKEPVANITQNTSTLVGTIFPVGQLNEEKRYISTPLYLVVDSLGIIILKMIIEGIERGKIEELYEEYKNYRNFDENMPIINQLRLTPSSKSDTIHDSFEIMKVRV